MITLRVVAVRDSPINRQHPPHAGGLIPAASPYLAIGAHIVIPGEPRSPSEAAMQDPIVILGDTSSPDVTDQAPASAGESLNSVTAPASPGIEQSLTLQRHRPF